MKKLTLFAAACLISVPVYAKTIATVNGQAISQDQLDSFVALLASQGVEDTPELREQVKQEIINRTIVVQAAEKAGIDKKEAVKQEIELARQGILVRALMTDHLENNPVSDAEIKKEYDAIKAEQAKTLDYKLRHILLEDEADAKKLLADIKAKTTSFEEAAKAKSIDSGSGERGGELGWGPASNYVPEFAEAVKAMQKGDLSTDPVKSQFGWHIIEVEDLRPIEFPEYEQVKPQLAEMLRQQKQADFQEQLLKSAKIK